MKNTQLLVYGAIGISMYLMAAGLSFAMFSYLSPPDKSSGQDPSDQQHFQIDLSAPKTAMCPINGKMHTEAERKVWETRRPLAVMIENHEESRPQSGLSSADVVYEAVAEGGITRFMGIYYCGSALPVTLAPVRSARIYFLPWVLEYDALYNHVGGAGRCNDPTVDDRAKALCRIEEWKIKDLDQFGISFPTCYRNYDRLDHPVATEHTMVCFSDKLYDIAKERGWTNVDQTGRKWDADFQAWKFKDDPPESSRGNIRSISYTAWKGYEKNYGVRWDYDSASNTYKRTNGGVAHMDLETGQQISAHVVIVLFAKETGSVDEHLHLLYDNIGTGKALVFQDGIVIEATWEKPTKAARTVFRDSSGKEITFTRGQFWISMVPIGTEVAY